jgi:putative ABC transport system permease protein
MTWLTAALIAAGALFGGLNTIYAAFASRIREIGTLQAIGFSPLAVLWSFLQESTLAAMSGAAVAGFLASTLSGRFTLYFSTGAFTPELAPETAWLGLLTGAALGVIGAIPPALRCLVPPLPAALREG